MQLHVCVSAHAHTASTKGARILTNRAEGNPLPFAARYFMTLLAMSWRARVIDVCLFASSNTTYANSDSPMFVELIVRFT